MTYSEAVSLQAAIEAGLLSTASGAVTITHNGRSITYGSKAQATMALAEVNRSIQTYKRRLNGQNPDWKSPKWR